MDRAMASVGGFCPWGSIRAPGTPITQMTGACTVRPVVSSAGESGAKRWTASTVPKSMSRAARASAMPVAGVPC
jgi:hypothetical protein